MVCIYCSGQTRVINSRPQKRLHQTWRRRTCVDCGAMFTTNESIDFGTSVTVRQENGRLRPFNRDELFMSVYRAVGHRERPITDAAALTSTITSKLLSGADAALKPNDITKATLAVLKRFDRAAAVQYAAYHK
jgi:transcriptional repressor NrdR